VNKKDTIKYNNSEGELTFESNGNSKKFTLDDIEYVERYVSYNHAAHKSSVAAWDEYNHSVIYLSSGQKFTITSLLVPDLLLPIPDYKIKVIKGVFRLAKSPSWLDS
ncbi:MAG TPA: hypothetical protein VGE24_11505, partial [Emticicia sp.]